MDEMMDCRWQDQYTSFKYGYSHACIQYTGSTMTYRAKHHAWCVAEESGQALINPMNHEKKSQAECLATQPKGPCGVILCRDGNMSSFLRLRLFMHLLKLGYKEIEVSMWDMGQQWHCEEKKQKKALECLWLKVQYMILCMGSYCQRSVFQQQAKRISTSSVRTPKHKTICGAPKMFFCLHKGMKARTHITFRWRMEKANYYRKKQDDTWQEYTTYKCGISI